MAQVISYSQTQPPVTTQYPGGQVQQQQQSVVKVLHSRSWSAQFGGGQPFSLETFVNAQPEPIVCLKFEADWCVPCKQVTPFFNALAQQSVGKIACFTVDVEKSEDIAVSQNITKLPTFIFYTTKLTPGKFTVIEQIIGPDKVALENLQNNFAKGVRVVDAFLAEHGKQSSQIPQPLKGPIQQPLQGPTPAPTGQQISPNEAVKRELQDIRNIFVAGIQKIDRLYNALQ